MATVGADRARVRSRVADAGPTEGSPPQQSARRSGLLSGGFVIALAMGVMNLTTYGFTILAARLLGPEEYGALAAVMGLLLVVNVVSLGLQATGARRVSSAPHDLTRIESEVLAASYRFAVVVGLLSLAAAPLVSAVLNLDSLWTAALIAATAVPLTLMGGQAGILQGERRWVALAMIYLFVGVGRLVFGTVALIIAPNKLSAMIGVTIGAVLPAIVGWLALRHPSRVRDRLPMGEQPWAPRWARGGVGHETMHNSHALLAFFALSNADVVIARSVLNEHQAGLYAAGLILAKAVLFLPQFVVVIAFPSMSKQPYGKRMQLLSLGVVLAIGAITVLAAALLSGLALVFVGGPQYAELQSRLWAFACLGTVLGLIQLMVYTVVARQHQRAVFVIWAALIAVVCVAPFVGSVTFLVTLVICIDSTLFVVLLLAGMRPAAVTEEVQPGAMPMT
jgi:O-antigen/teichoic acid export membrane protein